MLYYILFRKLHEPRAEKGPCLHYMKYYCARKKCLMQARAPFPFHSPFTALSFPDIC